jgi:hypothetical protein
MVGLKSLLKKIDNYNKKRKERELKYLNKSIIILVTLVSLSGCGAAKHPIHPGTANTFDSDTYDALMIADNIIKTTKTDLANNAYPASLVPNVKTALNKLITIYDDADKVYREYHTAAMAGAATPAQVQSVNNSIGAVNNSLTNLATAKGVR